VLALLHRICREDGITAVVSLHQVELARRYGDRIYGLAGGRIVFDGTAAELDAVTLDRIYGPASTPSVQPASTRREQNSARPKMAKTA